MVITDQEYTKHYYAGTQRIASKIGAGFDGALVDMDVNVATLNSDVESIANGLINLLEESNTCAQIESGNVTLPEPNLPAIEELRNISIDNIESDMYFYHTDHLGSSSWITDASGAVNQHLQYLPPDSYRDGEDYIYQRINSWNVPYTFSGKEKDEETGYSYFGARYYDSDLSIFLSVDRFTDKYPSLTPYQYTGNNPVNFIDINGDSVVDSKGNIVNITVNNNNGNYSVSFDFAAGTSDEVKKVFMENGGKLIEGMALTETGRTYIHKAIVSEEKIHYSIVEGTEDEPRMGDGGAVVGGTTKDVKKDGVYQYTQITVYEGSARYWKKRNKHDQNNLTYFQKMVTNAVHETHHAVSQPDISARKAGRRLTTKEHEGAYNAGHDTAFDFGILNGAYDEKIKK